MKYVNFLLLLSIFILTPVYSGLQAAPKNAQAEAAYAKAKALYDQKKYAEAFPLMEQAAKMGHSDAQMHLGKMYFNGWGVKHSHETAKIWHEKAAAQGNQESINKLKNFRH